MADALTQRRSADEVAKILISLHDRQFRSRRTGKYRISRSALRAVCGRHKLTERFLEEIETELFERGYVLVDLETYFAVMNQKLFDSFRRASSATVQRLLVT